MVLPPALFHWFYDAAFPAATQLANISGGTDLAGCFGMENPLTPVYAGGCQGPSLGTAVAVYDALEEGPDAVGRALPAGQPGELVAPKSFPNQPCRFWGADGPRRYREAYFARFRHVWTHGDFVQVHPRTGQILFLGRADGVLNPSGVRFGSAEIYNVVERLFAAEVLDSIVVGQRRPGDADESGACIPFLSSPSFSQPHPCGKLPADAQGRGEQTVMLFLKMQPGQPFTRSLVARLDAAIARECSKRHVPRYTFETPEIPVRRLSSFFLLLSNLPPPALEARR